VDDEWVADEDLGDADLVDPDAPVPRPTASPARRRTAGAAMLAAAMVGLQEALEGPRPEPAITEVGNSEPDDDDPVAIDLDPYDPSASVAVIRPWLHDPE
jgi:hypothetical protein